VPIGLPLNEGSGKLDHDAVEDAHDFIGTVGHGKRFAPSTCFGNAEAVLSEDVRSDVVFGADDEGSENARIGVDGLNCGRTVAHGSRFTPLRNWFDGMPKTKATLLLVCCSNFLP
jgi:hypothetical protein